ncbi:MAG: hypothetical protein E6I68_03065 [Chloroflexi bacterium]|nr:MAG: hypothetical protein E6I68_03065 [Chloroflexota bacterium]
MVRITAKLKIAAGLAAGALTLGGAGAYAAANANNTITVENPAPIALPNGGPTLISVDNKTLTLPTSFANQGECISFFAQNRDFALAPEGTLPSSVKLSKNYHGKLVSGLHDWCKAQLPAATKSDSTKTETPDATESDSASTDSLSGKLHGHGHAYGHGKHVAD